MFAQPIYRTYKRYRSLQTHRISALPIAILMPHSACNCRCAMCDIWKDNQNLQQLTEADIKGLLQTFKALGTQLVVMSGGEALLNKNFFRFCEILQQQGIKVSLLSTGLLLHKHAEQIVARVHDVVVSLDGDEATHDTVRNVEGAFALLKKGVQRLKELKPHYPITGRSVIHRLNFRQWLPIVEAAQNIGLDQISFLPADVSSEAFNRSQPWGVDRQQQIVPDAADLPELQGLINQLVEQYCTDGQAGFIAEPPAKLQKIHDYYAAYYGLNPYPYKKCNAPWVSTVVEADGTVRPCFFHAAMGNIHQQPLADIINSPSAIAFRKQLDMDNDATCVKCVCYLNLPPGSKV
jgi:Fe-coproporphyrin III synthase